MISLGLASLLYLSALAFFRSCRDCRADDGGAGGREGARKPADKRWHGKDLYQKFLTKVYAPILLTLIFGLDLCDAEGVVNLDTVLVRGDWTERRPDWLCRTRDRVCRITEFKSACLRFDILQCVDYATAVSLYYWLEEEEYAVVKAAVVYCAGIGSVERLPVKYYPFVDRPGTDCLQLPVRQIFLEELINVLAFIEELWKTLAAWNPGDGPLSLTPDMIAKLILVPLAIDPAKCSLDGEPYGVTRRLLDVLPKLAEATGDLFLSGTVLSGVHLRGDIVSQEMYDACLWRLTTMGFNATEIVELLDGVSGGEVMARIKSQEGTIKSQEGTIKSQEGTIKSQEGTIKSLEGANKSLADELAAARSSRVFAVLALRDAGKSPGEISETMKLDLSEVNRILGNGRG